MFPPQIQSKKKDYMYSKIANVYIKTALKSQRRDTYL